MVSLCNGSFLPYSHSLPPSLPNHIPAPFLSLISLLHPTLPRSLPLPSLHPSLPNHVPNFLSPTPPPLPSLPPSIPNCIPPSPSLLSLPVYLLPSLHSPFPSRLPPSSSPSWSPAHSPLSVRRVGGGHRGDQATSVLLDHQLGEAEEAADHAAVQTRRQPRR